MGQPYLSIAAKDNLQKPWAFGGECNCPQLLLSALPHIARKGMCARETLVVFPLRVQSPARRRPVLRCKTVPTRKKTRFCVSFFVLSGGFNSDILPWNPCTATACKFPAKNTRNFFEVLLTLFEPPVEFNADITRPAFGTHPAAVLASVLPLSADR